MVRLTSLFLLLVCGVAICAQESSPKDQSPATAQTTRPKNYLIAVTVLSKDARLNSIRPDLNNEAANEIERQAKNVTAMVVTGTKGEAAEQARRRNADYLVTIEFDPRPTAEIAVGGDADRMRSMPEVYGSDRANAQGRMFVAWTVDGLAGAKMKLHDSRYVNPAEYPLSGRRPNTGDVVGWDWVTTIAHRSVRDAAMNAMDKLRLKKGLGLMVEVKGEHGHESK